MIINLLEKKIRSAVIKEYLNSIGKTKVIVFTCGNASKYLRETGLEVLAVGDREELRPGKWFSQEEIAKNWPGHFNATSGDIPIFLIERIANRLRGELGQFNGGEIKVGSGETLLVLTIAYPEKIKKIIPVRDDTPETEYNDGATLNGLLKAIYKQKIWE